MEGDKIAARIAALLALAERTDNSDEQAAFTAKAQELQTKYNIDAARQQAAAGTPAEEVGTARIEAAGPGQPGGKALVCLLAALAEANGTACVVYQRNGMHVTVIGFPAELRAVEMLFASLRRQLDYAAVYALRHHRPAGVNGRAYRTSYMHGWVATVASRLREARQAAVAQATAEDTAGAPSAELVLRSRGERVQARKQQLFPKLGTFRDSYRPQASAYSRGRHDGQRAALGGELAAAGAAPAALAAGGAGGG